MAISVLKKITEKDACSILMKNKQEVCIVNVDEIKESTRKENQYYCYVDFEMKDGTQFGASYSFYLEDEGSATIYKCAKLFYSNDYEIVIITSQLWTGDNINSYIYTQMLFPKIDIKFNMAMRQTELNKQIFNQPDYLDAITCQPYNSWEDFIEPQPDDYKDGVFHNRTKYLILFLKVKLKN